MTEASNGLLEAALLGSDWREALSTYSEAAGAKGATLVRYQPRDVLKSRLHNEFVLSTDSLASSVADYLAGQAPPDPRIARVSPGLGDGFVTDFDQFTPDEIGRDAFYEEFLRPRDVRWHACARIDTSSRVGDLYLSLKRSVRQEHYSRAEIRAINACLPTIRMAAAISRTILQAEQRGKNSVFDGRGEALFEFDVRGRVIDFNPLAGRLIGDFLDLSRGQLSALSRDDTNRLARAIAAPLGVPPRVACVVLGEPGSDRRVIFKTFPVVGSAHDVFGATAAMAVATLWERPGWPPDALVASLRESFGLTNAEARIAALVGLGVSLAQSAATLGIGIGTARNYFKAAQTKIGVSRQAELVLLVGSMKV
ncbi:hypothetical protein LL06_08610 [Hoeflea sp. BAL378]|uniref:helix-turn-helix transcriptional regulator n=1 Tax=Hoeflea sp. BAL378 TaxID=1547437 RepID=UPI000512FE2C|nr:helix-turn-helix transcriptional regulator [Hoeflea sp. BAL378]KGF69870.1 hypothetical protein LL06_08610 [Hoeflea sp. BAL378]